ncbi:SDR family NAD(P)-dependent oxidoreductase [Pseudarthrobacter raffinosi]|uniref:SDR family NAD(P)-dependent oxidoreductase n=1 Tax=Pseudarthrobacter raffinosi TaxID=2953651 RepID=UPI00208FF9F2|nr:SDR family oxidoreductase [Pseudarthrobacter sp. MDT3-9]MCO4252138.1 SDR family oxidoreductase [Pseudarthrobacter sp. MDT3-9]
MLDFNGKTVVITAGASAMARCIARLMGGRGANLVIADIDMAAAEALAAELPSAVAAKCDVRSPEDIERVRDLTIDRFGPADIVMSHAGIGSAGLVQDISDEDWTRLLDLNVIGMARVIRAFLPDMLARESGHLILTSSSLALLPGHPVSVVAAPYITSKAAVIGLAQAIATAHRSQGIKVTLFAPDATDTGWAPEPARDAGRDKVREIVAGLPQYSRHTPEHAAEVLIAALDEGRFLASATPNHEQLLRLQADALLDPSAFAAVYVPA